MLDTLKIGDNFTTIRSNEQVKALEIVPNKNGSARVFVENSQGERRWTTVR